VCVYLWRVLLFLQLPSRHFFSALFCSKYDFNTCNIPAAAAAAAARRDNDIIDKNKNRCEEMESTTSTSDCFSTAKTNDNCRRV